MGNYASNSDVERHLTTFFTTPFTSGTTPTDTVVGEMIDQAEAQVNGVLSAQGYNTVPATGTNDVNMLKLIVGQYVAALVFEDYYHTQGDLPQPFKRYLAGFEGFITRLTKGEAQLIDQNPESKDDPVFMVVRTPTRDDTFSDRTSTATDWDE